MDTRASCERTKDCFYLEGHSGSCNKQDSFIDRSTVLMEKAFVTQPCFAACNVGQPHTGPCIVDRSRVHNLVSRCTKYEPQATCSLASTHEGACALTPNNLPKTNERPSVTEAFKEVSRALDGLTKEEAGRVLRAVAVLMDIKF